MIGYLVHFLLDFFGQMWTQGALRYILGPILVIFEYVTFLQFHSYEVSILMNFNLFTTWLEDMTLQIFCNLKSFTYKVKNTCEYK